ncbi:hypothetical protein [Endozoicomonas sp. ALB032]|uniref:hypothetical protein n=1 Tax=Endozoicomonas sp. ALB032 TaxID=3403082 RepID=UPI003BB79BB9
MVEVYRPWSSQPNVVANASIWTVFRDILLISPSAHARCAMCRQNPMPVVNQNTSESLPDTFFPDWTFYGACNTTHFVLHSLQQIVNVKLVKLSFGQQFMLLGQPLGVIGFVKSVIVSLR